VRQIGTTSALSTCHIHHSAAGYPAHSRGSKRVVGEGCYGVSVPGCKDDTRASEATILSIDALEKRYGDVVALAGASFAVAPGRILGFLGPNGAGKTTAMRCILGLVRPDTGEVRWQGRVVTDQDRLRFGYMPEERGLYPKMRVRDQLVHFGRLSGLSAGAAGEATDSWLAVLGLAERANDKVDDLSHGNQQRVQLAAALVHDPVVLILDEPFSGLDPLAVVEVTGTLRDLANRGAAIVFSSHQLDLVEDVEARIARVVRLVDEHHSLDEMAEELGRLLRIAADIADPAVLGAGSAALRRVVPEYYRFVGLNLTKFPLVRDGGLPSTVRGASVRTLLVRVASDTTASVSPLAKAFWQDGRVVPAGSFDYRSVPYAKTSLSYSRGVTAASYLWLAAWAKANGDFTGYRFGDKKP